MHVLGIDAGGSKTVALLADVDGQIVGEGRGGGANLQAHGELEVEKVLHHVIDLALGGRPIVPAAVCLGLAGVDREGDGDVIRGIMRRLGFRAHTLIVNDALIALVAGVGGTQPGVVLISGTGSIAYGVSGRGVAARAGGWGAALGDEGSGYWVGRRALAAVVRAADGRGPRTQLTSLVLRHFSLERPEQLVAEIYDTVGGLSIASLGETVERARAQGDAVAAEILREAVAELVLAVTSVVSRLGMRGDRFPTMLAGGMLTGVPWLAAEVTRQIAEVAPLSVVSPLAVEPASGAVWLALADASGRLRVPPYLDEEGVTPEW